MKTRSFLILTIAVLGVLTAVAQPKIVCHRGFYNSPGADENSITALVNAHKLGVYGVEFDVNLTTDKEVVVVHGPKILGTDIVVQQSSWAEISKATLPNGNKVPTFREWMLMAKKCPGLKQIIEFKKHSTPELETELVERVVAICRELDVLDIVEFSSFSYHICKECARLVPGCQSMYINSSFGAKCVGPEQAKRDGLTALVYNCNIFMNRPDLVDGARANGMQTTMWLVNQPEVVDWAIRHNVDYVSSDYPDRIKAYISTPKVKRAAAKAAKNVGK